jgi:phage replication-related protein YjqB (UPF0714/DUF867 family)
MFAELLAEPGVTELVELRSSFGFMAFHGGSLEEVTDAIAIAAAEQAEASVYAVIQPPGLRWHIPSRMVRPSASLALAAFLDHVDVALAVHGYGREGMWTSLLLGGSNRALAAHVASHLRPALPHYEIVDELDAIPPALRGIHPQNPINVAAGGGVQLELPPRVRGKGPFWQDHVGDGLKPHTQALVAALAAAAAAWGSR